VICTFLTAQFFVVLAPVVVLLVVVSLTVTTYVDKYMLLRVVNSKSLLFYDDSGAVAAVNFVGFMTVITSTAGFVITSVMRSKIDGISLQVSFAASILVSIQSNPIHLKTNSTQLNSTRFRMYWARWSSSRTLS